MNYLIDTDWVIDHFHHIEPVTRRLEELAPQGLALSIVSLAELYEGVYYSRNPAESEEVLQRFLDPSLSVLGIDEEMCKIFGRERGRLRAAGHFNDADACVPHGAGRTRSSSLAFPTPEFGFFSCGFLTHPL
jgi:predicted nucleic acid-binding protein